MQIGEDEVFQARAWKVERVAWVLIWLLLAAALAGVAGGGLLSHARAGDPSRLAVEYERVLRQESPARLVVHVGRQAPSGGKLRLWVDATYLEQLHIERIVPEPERRELAGERVVLEYPAAAAPASITIHYQAEAFGRRYSRVGIEGGPEVLFRQFILP